MSKTINNANGLKNSSNVAVKEQMEKNVVNYIKAALGVDLDLSVTDIDEEYGLLEISNDCWKVQMTFDGRLCEFLTEDVWLDIENLDAIATIMHNQNDIIKQIKKGE